MLKYFVIQLSFVIKANELVIKATALTSCTRSV